MKTYKVQLSLNHKDDFSYFNDEAYFLAERLDEFECNLRDIVGDLIAQYLWRLTHEEETDSFKEVVEKILRNNLKANIFIGNVDEFGEVEEETNKLLKSFGN